jgi:hypothetical protein
MKKKENTKAFDMSADELIVASGKKRVLRKRAKFILALVLVVPVALGAYLKGGLADLESTEEISVSMVSAPIAATASKRGTISIPTGMVNPNPFLPYRDISGTAGKDNTNYDLVEPPEMISENSAAAKLLNTVVSGILYDKYSPSAILKIDGSDYLVKKGDVIKEYKILHIAQDSVTVKLGDNTFNAGIGEILTEGSVHHNDVSNLSNKFGGN